MKAYRLPGGKIAYPVTLAEKGKWIGDGYDIALPGTPEHAQWLPFAVDAPKGMFTPAPAQESGDQGTED